MNQYEFKATGLIAETFVKHGVCFEVKYHDGMEELRAPFPIESGPVVIMRFISRDNDNDVAVRVFGLISRIPEEKRAPVAEVCNALNQKVRFLKFCLDTDGDVSAEYDFPMRSPDEGIGEMAFEIFIRMMHILGSEYGAFMKALCLDGARDLRNPGIPEVLMRKLEELRRMRETRPAAADDSDDGAESDDTWPGPDTADGSGQE